MTRYERRAPRWVHAVALLATVGLTGALIYFVFVRGTDAYGSEFGTGFKIGMGLACAVGIFLAGVFLYRLVRNPVIFAMHDQGFWYAPGGVSTGLIRWADIVELREEGVLESGGSGTRVSRALAVVLKDPEEYVSRYPAPLRPLLRKRGELNSSPLMLRVGDFGADYPRIKAAMDEQVRAQAGAR